MTPGNFAKFSSPTIANGKVYLGTFSNQLIVYGLTVSIPDTCNTPNIALNKTAVASSLEGAQFPAAAAFDGDINTRWSSEYSDPQRIYVDLGKRYDLCTVVLHWEAAYGRDFKIQVSDDAINWQTMANFTGNNSTFNVIKLKGAGRYVGMYGTARATPYGYSLYELEVYGTPSVYSCAAPVGLVAGNIYENSVTVNWQKNGADSFSLAYKPVNAVDWTTAASGNNAVTLTGLTCGTDYYFKVQSICSDTSMSQYSPVLAFSTLNCNSNCGLLPVRWRSQDIGNTALQGSACYANGIFSLRASGNDIWDVSDQFHFTYAVLQGDGSFVARVSSMDQSNAWNKCGIMIRESLDPGSKHAFVTGTSGNGIAFQYRQNSDDYSTNTNDAGFTVPYWIKLVKNGSFYTAFRSPDNSSWTQVGSGIDLAFGNNTPVYCGLALTSHDNTILSTAVVDNFSSSGFTETDLQSFTGEITAQQKVQLNWTTSLEINTDYFIVEKSNDNILFTAIDSVPAANSGRFMTNYQSSDNNPSQGIIYYRLKMVDILGNYKYSQLVVIRLSGNKVPLIYPNPATGNVNILQGSDAIKSVSIYDLMGRLMLRLDNDNNNSLINIPLYSLARSVYVVEIRTSNSIFRNKLLKR